MILGVGHPRTGTGYTAKVCNLWGLKVGHEIPEKDGVIGWQYVQPVGPYPFIENVDKRPSYSHLVYNVRNPADSLASIFYTEDTNVHSKRFREKFITVTSKTRIEFSISSIISFDNLITKMNPNITYRIEDQQKDLFDYLSQYYSNILYSPFSQKVNARKHNELEEVLSKHNVSDYHKDLINGYCEKHGYPSISF